MLLPHLPAPSAHRSPLGASSPRPESCDPGPPRAGAGQALLVFLVLAALLLSAAPARAQEVPQQPIHPDKTGQALLDALQQDYAPDRTLGYGPARDRLYRYLDDARGEVVGVYGGYSVDIPPGADPSQAAYQGGDGLSAEHTWPQSKGAGREPRKSDLHNLFPVQVQVNSARGNRPFDDIPDAQTDTWYVRSTTRSTVPASNIDAYSEGDGQFPDQPAYGARFEPREDHKGNAARALFYFRAVYPDASTDEGFFEAQRRTLVEWHNEDPVDAAEVDRSQWIAERQGTNNPFVLDTTLVRRAFQAPSGPTVELAAASAQVREGETIALTVRLNDPEGTAVSVDLALASSTADPADFDGYQTQTVRFAATASDGATKEVAVRATDDDVAEGDETGVFRLQNVQPSSAAALGAPSAAEVTVADDDGAPATDLLISQYVETNDGTTPKGIEVWNVSGGPIDFGARPLTVRTFFNGQGDPTEGASVSEGTLARGAVMVIGGSALEAHMRQNAPSVRFVRDAFNFNGNDALELVLGGATQDVFGTIGADPGDAWEADGVSTEGQNLRLQAGITAGNPDGFDAPSTRFETVVSDVRSEADLADFGVPPEGPLPVELAGLEARADGRAGVVSWSTASETNNAGFAVEHRRRTEPAGAFEALAFVDGAGTTTEPQSYAHRTGALDPGRHVFRLRQVNVDGTASYSREETLTIEPAAPLVLTAPAPNPSRRHARLRVAVAERRTVEVALYDALGRRVQSLHEGPVQAGGAVSLSLPTAGLPSGLYVVRAVAGGHTATRRLTVVR